MSRLFPFTFSYKLRPASESLMWEKESCRTYTKARELVWIGILENMLECEPQMDMY